MQDRCTRTTASLLALLAGSIAGSLAMTGCSDRGSDSRAVAEASRHLASVGNADAPSSTVSYASASSKISAAKVEGDAASAVTAGLLSQSLQGEGSVAIKVATLAERTVFDDLAMVRDLSSTHAALMTEAQALEEFDPTADLDRLADESSALEQSVRAARSARGSLAERINLLENRAATLGADSSAKRERAAEMGLASSSLSATEAAPRAGTIRILSREADALDMQIARLTGEVETLRPRLTEFDAEIAKFTEQIEIAAEAADDLRQMATERAARARTARASAGEIAEQIRSTVNAIDSARTDTIIPAGDTAQTALEKAVRESEKAARGVRAPASLGKAAAQRRLAELFQLRGDGHARYADALESLAGQEGLPNANAYADAAQQERAQADEFRLRAAEAYENASNSLSSVNIRGTDADRARETADRLLALARTLRGEPSAPDASQDESQNAPENNDEAGEP